MGPKGFWNFPTEPCRHPELQVTEPTASQAHPPTARGRLPRLSPLHTLSLEMPLPLSPHQPWGQMPRRQTATCARTCISEGVTRGQGLCSAGSGVKARYIHPPGPRFRGDRDIRPPGHSGTTHQAPARQGKKKKQTVQRLFSKSLLTGREEERRTQAEYGKPEQLQEDCPCRRPGRTGQEGPTGSTGRAP